MLNGYWHVGWFVDGGFQLLIEMVVSSCLVRNVLLGQLVGEMSVEVVRVDVECCVPCSYQGSLGFPGAERNLKLVW